MKKIKTLLQADWFLWGLFWINLFGSIYGFYWYKNQLFVTDWYWLIFVPDSPTASTFFTLLLWLFLHRQRSPLIEAFAAITLVKYGLWAVVVIVWGGMLATVPFTDALHWEHWMLIASHLGMVLQAVLYAPFYTFKWKEIGIVTIWLIVNDLLDYHVDIHPWVVPPLEVAYHTQLEIVTYLLSAFSILLFMLLATLPSKDRRFDLPIDSISGRDK